MNLNNIKKGDDLILLVGGQQRPFTVTVKTNDFTLCENQSDIAIFTRFIYLNSSAKTFFNPTIIKHMDKTAELKKELEQAENAALFYRMLLVDYMQHINEQEGTFFLGENRMVLSKQYGKNYINEFIAKLKESLRMDIKIEDCT